MCPPLQNKAAYSVYSIPYQWRRLIGTEHEEPLILFEGKELHCSFRGFHQHRGQNSFVQGEETLGAGHFPNAVENSIVVGLERENVRIQANLESVFLLTPVLPATVPGLACSWSRVFTKSNGCMMQTSTKPADPPAPTCIAAWRKKSFRSPPMVTSIIIGKLYSHVLDHQSENRSRLCKSGKEWLDCLINGMSLVRIWTMTKKVRHALCKFNLIALTIEW